MRTKRTHIKCQISISVKPGLVVVTTTSGLSLFSSFDDVSARGVSGNSTSSCRAEKGRVDALLSPLVQAQLVRNIQVKGTTESNTVTDIMIARAIVMLLLLLLLLSVPVRWLRKCMFR